jgi:hypothetical protein
MPRRHPALVPLSHDHRRALGLAFRLRNPAPPGPITPMTPPSTPASRRLETLEAWDGELRLHFAIEEEDLFPAIRAAAGDTATRALVDRLVAEHRRLGALRDAVAAADAAELDAALRAFAELLEAHVRLEERELFAGFPGPLGAAEVERLGRTIHARRPPDASPG